MKKQLLATVAVIALGTFASSAYAAFDTETPAAASPVTFNVVLKVKSACSGLTANSGTIAADGTGATGADIDFGTVDPTSVIQTDLQKENKGSSNLAIAVKCTKGVNYRIGLKPQTDGNLTGGGKMSDGAATPVKIGYQLLQSGYATNWGYDSPGAPTLNSKAFSATSSALVHHQVWAQATLADVQAAPAGVYKDTVQVFVQY